MTVTAVFVLFAVGCAHAPPAPAVALPAGAAWVATSAPTYKGKQDDVFFVDARTGLYANGAGDVFRTDDGGATWARTLSKPGTYWRALGMLDGQHGFLGNIGTEYFPGVSDETPLYRTDDGGHSVTPVDLGPVKVKGLCAIDVLKAKFINAGVLEERTVIHAAGRVGGPAWLVRSLDGGQSWAVVDLGGTLAMVTDVKFMSEMVGYVAGASDVDLEHGHAVIAKTLDGGRSWQRVYESTRPLELIWKFAWPTGDVGYATVMHYDPNRAQQVVAKTTDGGRSWVELPLTSNAQARQFGVGFASADLGWVGTAEGGFQTVDGGRSWAPVDLGKFANKIRILRTGPGTASPGREGFIVEAVGTNVYLLDARAPAPAP